MLVLLLSLVASAMPLPCRVQDKTERPIEHVELHHEGGKLIRADVYSGRSGNLRGSYDYRWSDGRLTGLVLFDGAGSESGRWTYSFRGERCIGVEYDKGSNSRVDERAAWSWEGRTVEGFGDGPLPINSYPSGYPQRPGWVLDFAGTVTSNYTKSVALGPSDFDWVKRWTYNSEGKLVKEEVFLGGMSSRPDRSVTYTWRDNRLVTERHNPPDLIAGEEVTHSYKGDHYLGYKAMSEEGELTYAVEFSWKDK
ncbi:MAG: hypothetical protein HN348_19615, partial [Proteobacteria bacterium]|nr:hypothetical protein [Pseudomonadota bacterium]